MPATLPEFFATMGPFLRGEIDAAAVEQKLGASPSGTDSLAFYGVMIRRNERKILREMYPSVHQFATAHWPERFGEWVDGFAATQHVDHHNPNAFGFEFPDYLASLEDVPPFISELADYHLCRFLAHSAPVCDDHGFDQRLFIRHYTHKVVDVAKAAAGGDTTVPEPAPTNLLIYREAGGTKVKVYYPSVAALVVLIHRQTGQWPPQPTLEPEVVAEVVEQLERRRILASAAESVASEPA